VPHGAPSGARFAECAVFAKVAMSTPSSDPALVEAAGAVENIAEFASKKHC
jgi:hypothetical protein